ncbi:transglycosylase SLT domain-containing protein [Neorhizobium galegae]|uniref:lytic transglycosylase domain-containing protein n=1 Tax=Neorhizobium galegae TaxID=399 RepID=UPI002105340F|nr:transglycosylase SLT domain-containing protein [Neorhizobium galegae]MCQ1847086.1 transglycosylase SLT domain-containing protein [Neorhizobium galegae]
MFFLPGLVSSSSDNGPQRNIENPDQALVIRSSEAGALPTPIAASYAAVVENHLLPPSIDLASFNQRFAGNSDTDTLAANPLRVDQAGVDFGDRDPELSGEAAGSVRARRERAVLSPISAFSFDPGTTRPHADTDLASMQPRPDLLSGIPDAYAELALTIAVEEGVDPNWVLSIMRAENAGFDPRLVSSAGAIGLMQVMPKIGEAFGAHDLTDPPQNIRAATRFLRVLIDKYRNPVLIASAYNAGEPRVDIHQSLPLIRETADYVTRVVGYYTGAAAPAPTPQAGKLSRAEPGPPRRIRTADRARSPMLIFSVADPRAPETRLHKVEEANQFGGPLKIVKEEVHQ